MSKKSRFQPCTAKEFDDFVANYGKKLHAHVITMGDPPAVVIYDPALGDLPESKLGHYYVDDYLAKEFDFTEQGHKRSGWHILGKIEEENEG